MVDRVSMSIVRITGEREVEGWFGAQQVTYTCSGEVIAINRVLTAAHCVGEKLLSDGTVATPLSVNEDMDLALLQTKTSKPALVRRETQVLRYEPLTAIGYAWGLTSLSALSVTPFLIDITPEKGLSPGILVQPAYIGGMSGGPVVDESGQMIGIVQASTPEGVGYGVGVKLIEAFLVGTN